MDIQPFLNELSPSGILITLAALACVESLAIVGILVPGVALLTILSALAAQAEIAISAVLLSGFVGAVVGDGLSYGLGALGKDSVHRWPGFRTHPQWLQKSTAFMETYGSYAVVIGRFIGPIRPFIPVAAGLLKMPPKQFFLLNIFSAAIWSPVYLLPGYLTGAWLDFNNAAVLVFTLLISLIAMAFTYFFHKRSN